MNRWSLYSIILILLIFVILALRFYLFPNFLDIYYHLSYALGLDKAGGFTSHTFWEYAPYGRVNLYPPFFSLLLLCLIKIGIPLINIARSMDVIIFPLFLLLIWFILNSIFNSITAFFSVAIAAFTYSLYLSSSNFVPMTCGVMEGLLCFWAVEQGKYRLASVLLGLTFYTHIQIPWLFVFTFLIYALVNKKYIYFKVVLCAIALGLPFLFYLLKNAQSYHFSLEYEHFVEEINLCLVFSCIGIKKVFKQRERYFFPIILFLISILFSLLYPYRYLSGQGTLGIIVLAAVGIEHVLAKFAGTKLKIFALVLILFCIVCAPSFIKTKDHKLIFLPLNSTPINLIWRNHEIQRGNEQTLYTRHIQEIVKIVHDNSAPNDIIYTNLPLVGTMIATMAERSDAGGMLREVSPKNKMDPVLNAKLIIWFKDEQDTNLRKNIIQRYSLTELFETPMAYIYRNNSTKAQMHVEKPLISNQWMFIIVVGLFAFALPDFILIKNIFMFGK